jgi:hypothetical protein
MPSSSGPIVKPVSAKSLPQIKGDPYENVEPSDFSTADKMTRAQMLLLADIASLAPYEGVKRLGRVGTWSR